LKATSLLQITLQLGLWIAADDVKHCMSFGRWTLVSRYKATLLSAGFVVAVVSLEAVH